MNDKENSKKEYLRYRSTWRGIAEMYDEIVGQQSSFNRFRNDFRSKTVRLTCTEHFKNNVVSKVPNYLS